MASTWPAIRVYVNMKPFGLQLIFSSVRFAMLPYEVIIFWYGPRKGRCVPRLSDRVESRIEETSYFDRYILSPSRDAVVLVLLVLASPAPACWC